MAKNLLLNVLVDVLGKFVDGLAVENLKVGVFSGKIELQNLKLKTSALEELDLPVTVTNGSLKHLNLKIPWTSLESKPVRMEIDGLLLQLGPFDIQKANAEQLKKAILNAKHAALLKIEDSILQSATLENKDAANYMQKLAVKIIDNIEVSITNVHVRYEDFHAPSQHHFAAGLTLESISVSTTDRNWTEKFVTRDERKGKSDTIHKLGNMRNCTVYWNPEVDPWGLLSPDAWETQMMGHIFRGESAGTNFIEEMHYIVKPPNDLSVKVAHCEQPKDPDSPKVDVNVSSSYLLGGMDKLQLHQIMACAQTFKMLEYRKQMAKYRPSVGPAKDPRAWWKYAYKMVTGRVESRREQMASCVLCIVNKDEYINRVCRYRRRALGLLKGTSGSGTKGFPYPSTTGIPPEQMEEALLAVDEQAVLALEASMPYAQLKAYREYAARSMVVEIKKYNEAQRERELAEGKKKTTFSSMFGWGKDKDKLADVPPPPPADHVPVTDAVPVPSAPTTTGKDKEKDKSSWFGGWGKKDKEKEKPAAVAAPTSTPAPAPAQVVSPPAPTPRAASVSDTASDSSLSSDDDLSLDRLEQQLIGGVDEVVAGADLHLVRLKLDCSAAFTVTTTVPHRNSRSLCLTETLPILEAAVHLSVTADVHSEKQSASVLLDRFCVKDLCVDRQPWDPQYLVAGVSDNQSPRLELSMDKQPEKTDVSVSAGAVVLTWNRACISALLDVLANKPPPTEDAPMEEVGVMSAEAMARLNQLLRADSVAIDMAERMTGTSILVEVEAPKIVVPFPTSRRSVGPLAIARAGAVQDPNEYLLVDVGHFTINADLSKEGVNVNMNLCQLSASMWSEVPDCTKTGAMSGAALSDTNFVIKPFTVCVIAQGRDKSVADFMVEVSVAPEIRASLDAFKIANLLRIANVMTATFAVIASDTEDAGAAGSRTAQAMSAVTAVTMTDSPTDLTEALLPEEEKERRGRVTAEELVAELALVKFRFVLTVPVVALDFQYCAKRAECASIVATELRVALDQRREDMAATLDIRSFDVMDIATTAAGEVERRHIVYTPISTLAPPTGATKSSRHAQHPFIATFRTMKSELSPMYTGNFMELRVELYRLCIDIHASHITRWTPFWVDLSGELGEVTLQRARAEAAAEAARAAKRRTSMPGGLRRLALDQGSVPVAEEASPVTGSGPQSMHFRVFVRDIVINFLRSDRAAPGGFQDAYCVSLSRLVAQARIQLKGLRRPTDLIESDVSLLALDIVDRRESSRSFAYKTLFTQLRGGVLSQFESPDGRVRSDSDQTANETECSHVFLENMREVPDDASVEPDSDDDDGATPEALERRMARYALVVAGTVEDGCHTNGEVTVNNLTSFVSMDATQDLAKLCMESVHAALRVSTAPAAADARAAAKAPRLVEVDAPISPTKPASRRNSRDATPSPMRSPSRSTQRPLSKVAEQERLPSVSIQLTVRDPLIILMEDCSRADCKCIVAKCAVGGRYDASTSDMTSEVRQDAVTCDVKDAEVFVLNNAFLDSYSARRRLPSGGRRATAGAQQSSRQPRHLIDPLCLMVRIERQFEKDVNFSTSVKATLDGLSGRVSVNDVLLFRSILKQQQVRASALEASDMSHEMASMLADGALETVAEREVDSDDEMAVEQPEEPVPVSTATSITLYSVVVNVGTVQLTAINDRRGQAVSVLRFGLQNTFFKASGPLSDVEGKGMLGLSVDFYNEHLEAWEPVLETTRPELDVTRRGADISASMSVPAGVQVNVSGSMYRSLMLTVSLLEQLTASDEAALATVGMQGGAAHPLSVVNTLGVDVDLSDSDSTLFLMRAYADGSVRELPDLATAAFMVEQTRSATSTAASVPVNRSKSKRPVGGAVSFSSAVDVAFCDTFGENRRPLQQLAVENNNRATEYVSQLHASGGGGGGDGSSAAAAAAAAASQEPVEEEVYENTRFNPFMQKWVSPFVLGDPARWSDVSGTLERPEPAEVPLPSNGLWEWTGPWREDLSLVAGGKEGKTDARGWEYGPNFMLFAAGKNKKRGFVPLDCCRRRRLTRVRRCKDQMQLQGIRSKLTQLDKCVVVWDVKTQPDGTRQLSLHSGLRVRNEMPFPINVRLQRDLGSADDTFLVEHVPEQTTVDVPIYYAQFSKLYVRPYAAGQDSSSSAVAATKDTPTKADLERAAAEASAKVTYFWSELIDCTAIPRGGAVGQKSSATGAASYRSCVLVCGTEGAAHPPVAMRYHIEQSASGRSVVAVFSPVAIIKNHMPCLLRYHIHAGKPDSDSGSGSGHGHSSPDDDCGVILPGRSAAVVHVPEVDSATASFQLGSFQWSKPSALVEPPMHIAGARPASRMVDLNNPGESTVAISFTATSQLLDCFACETNYRKSSGQVITTLSVSGAVVDYTGLGIHVRTKRVIGTGSGGNKDKDGRVEQLVTRSTCRKLSDDGPAGRARDLLDWEARALAACGVCKSRKHGGDDIALPPAGDGPLAASGASWAEGADGMALLHSDDDTMRVGVNNGESWGGVLSLKAVTDYQATFEVRDVNTSAMYQLAYSVGRMPGVFEQTRVAMVVPCFRVVNATDYCIDIRQIGAALGVDGGGSTRRASIGSSSPVSAPPSVSSAVVSIDPTSSKAWHKYDPGMQATTVQFRCRDLEENMTSGWSFGGVDINGIGGTDLLLPVPCPLGVSGHSGEGLDSGVAHNPIVLHVEVKYADITNDRAYLTVLIWKCDVAKRSAAFSLKNETSHTLVVRQVGIEAPRGAGSPDKGRVQGQYIADPAQYDICVLPNQWVPFGWANPLALMDSGAGSTKKDTASTASLQFMVSVGDSFDDSHHKTPAISDALSDSCNVVRLFGGKQLCTSVQGLGSGRVIRFCKTPEHMKSTFSTDLTGLLASYLTDQYLKGCTFKMNAEIRTLGLSLIAERPTRRELLAAHLGVVSADFSHTVNESLTLELKVADLQVDTFCEAAISPVLLHSRKLDDLKTKEKREQASLPVMHVSVHREYPVGSLTPVYKYVAGRVLPLHCLVDTGSLRICLMDLFPDLRYVGGAELEALERPTHWLDAHTETVRTQVAALAHGQIDADRSMEYAQSAQLYFREMVMHPLKLVLSLKHTVCPPREGAGGNGAAAKLFQVLDMVGSLVEVDDLDIVVSSFHVVHCMLTPAAVVSRYAAQVQGDVQGNAVSLAGTYFGGLDMLGNRVCLCVCVCVCVVFA